MHVKFEMKSIFMYAVSYTFQDVTLYLGVRIISILLSTFVPEK